MYSAGGCRQRLKTRCFTNTTFRLIFSLEYIFFCRLWPFKLDADYKNTQPCMLLYSLPRK